MILRKGDEFIEALQFQRQCHVDEDKAKTKAAKKGARERYWIWTNALNEYVKNMNSKGERDNRN